MKKSKIIAVLFAVLVAVSMCAVAVSAGESTTATLSGATVKPGEKAVLTITVANCAPVDMASVLVSWDPALEIVVDESDWTDGMLANAFAAAYGTIYNTDGVWSSLKKVDINGEIFSVTFNVADTVAEGEYDVSINLKIRDNAIGDVYNKTLTAKVKVEIPHEHVFDKEIADAKYLKTAGTCVDKAVYYKSCECGEAGTATFEGAINAGNHVGGTYVVGKAEANCTTDGYTGDVHCNSCDALLSSGTVETQTGHSYVNNADAKYLVTAGTCVDKAVYYKSCEKCGIASEVTFEGELDANNHIGETEVRDAKEATEKEDGYTGDTYCKACGAKLAEGEVIPKTGKEDVDTGDMTVVILAVFGAALAGAAVVVAKKKKEN